MTWQSKVTPSQPPGRLLRGGVSELKPGREGGAPKVKVGDVMCSEVTKSMKLREREAQTKKREEQA